MRGNSTFQMPPAAPSRMPPHTMPPPARSDAVAPAAYDAHARMLRVRAQRMFAAGSGERALGLGEALEVLSEGLDNVNDEFKTALVELRTEILGELGLESEAIAELEKQAQQ